MADEAPRSPRLVGRPKQRRIGQACDYCHQRSIRCQPIGGGGPCKNCHQFNQPCTYHRKPRKRGARSKAAAQSSTAAQERQLTPQGTVTVSQPLLAEHRGATGKETQQQDSWHAPFIVSQAVIMDLVELYFEIVYPIFPFFHQPSFLRRVSRAHYSTDKSFFAVTMAICALIRSRVRDGSITNSRWDLDALKQPGPDVFYKEAQRQTASFGMTAKLDVLRAHAILAITAIQNGNIREMRWHLGTYQSLVAVDGLHDEANWPHGIGVVEREERRRLFWSIYTLDIFTSSVCGGIVQSREAQSNVLYPAEIEDEIIDERSDSLPMAHSTSDMTPSSSDRPSLKVYSDCWLSGWNFITDLYRVLEHALTKFRSPRKHNRSFLNDIFHDDSTLTEASVRESVLEKYMDLRPCFKIIPPMTYDPKKDRVSFQAANISGTVQLLRIMLCVAGDASIEDRCRVAGDAIDALASIPVPYSRAISTPLLHHLSGIGVILGSVFEEQLSEADYSRVRSIMLFMADVLDGMEVIQHASGASDNLRGLVARIDDYMNTQRQGAQIRQRQDGNANATFVQPGLTAGHDAATNSYEQIVPDIPEGWSFQLPPDFLGELSWDFELGPWTTWSS